MSSATNTRIVGICPSCGRHGQRTPVRVSSEPAEPLPGFGEPRVQYRLTTYTVRCAACRHVWHPPVEIERAVAP